ncbi:DNA cytosine methyltransferase [Dyella sedimenti]|uniref:DNA cytosine methyltransferase n=1 Tax=Dyella sedimenti TaxID=2919947 RepID=UPI001FA96026|nr:DNA cytosine methyltransferase [Dyella sedimenti]
MKKTKNAPRVIDLFAGVGGMSLGAARAGFDLAAAVELDKIAINTHAINFPNSHHLRWDISRTAGANLLEAAGLVRGELDGLVGGPPCQGFSDIGKRATDDPRNSLFGDFFRLVADLRPRFFVAENVPGILAERNQAAIQMALSQVPADYVVLEAREVAANNLGAATLRSRVFFVGYDPKRVARFNEAKLFANVKSTPVTVGKALVGLPIVRSDWQSEAQGWRYVDPLLPTDRFYKKVIDEVPLGVGSPEAIKRLYEKNEVSGNLGTRHTDEVIKRFQRTPQGSIESVSRAPRLAENGFCPTLRAGTASDRGSFQAVRPIHFRSPRVITPREAARLQGFPDWFQFHGTKWHSFRQIGNSVSPIVAETLLERIRSMLD